MTRDKRSSGERLSLLEAFEQLGLLQDPDLADDATEAQRIREENGLRQRAATRVRAELEALADRLAKQRFGGRRTLLEDAIQDTLIRVAKLRPRRLRGVDPEKPKKAEVVVRSYLRRALLNNALDLLEQEREDSLDWDVEGEAEWPTELAIDLEQARTRLFDEIVPAVANGKRTAPARDGFFETIEQLRRIADGETSLDALVTAELESEASTETDRKRAVNRLHKRYSRALAELDQGVGRFVQEQGLSQTERDHLGRWLDWLRLGSGSGG